MKEQLHPGQEHANWQAPKTGREDKTPEVTTEISEDEFEWLKTRTELLGSDSIEESKIAAGELANNLDLIERAGKMEEFRHFALKLASLPLRFLSPQEREKLLEFIGKQIVLVQNEDFAKDNLIDHQHVIDATLTLYRYGNTQQKNFAAERIQAGLINPIRSHGLGYAAELIGKAVNSKDSKEINWIFELIRKAKIEKSFGAYGVAIAMGKEFTELQTRQPLELEFDLNLETEINEFFKEIGLEEKSDELFKIWKMDDQDQPGGTTGEQIARVLEVESEAPGAIKTLHDEFGIKTPARYPKEMLVNQYRERNNRDKRYGALIYPRYDGHGGFYMQEEPLRDLYNQLQKLGVELRVTEAGTKFEAGRRLVNLSNRYGPKSDGSGHKMDFLLLGGHGIKEEIMLGRAGALTIHDVMSSRSQEHIRSFFEPKSTVILVACSTGIEEGIGQEISRITDNEVIAPKEPTNLGSIEVSRSETGELKFEVEYWKRNIDAKYVGGQPQ